MHVSTSTWKALCLCGTVSDFPEEVGAARNGCEEKQLMGMLYDHGGHLCGILTYIRTYVHVCQSHTVHVKVCLVQLNMYVTEVYSHSLAELVSVRVSKCLRN